MKSSGRKGKEGKRGRKEKHPEAPQEGGRRKEGSMDR